jgi:hypothetical protein
LVNQRHSSTKKSHIIKTLPRNLTKITNTHINSKTLEIREAEGSSSKLSISEVETTVEVAAVVAETTRIINVNVRTTITIRSTLKICTNRYLEVFLRA